LVVADSAQKLSAVRRPSGRKVSFFPIAVAMRLSCPAVLLSLILCHLPCFGAGKEIEGERAPAATACPSPEEARAKMSVPEGYEVRCFAHEPMVQNPVAMTWDHRGRLWVVEAYEYPEGSPHPAPFGGEAEHDRYQPMPTAADKLPRDRVIILEDTDGDGEADKRTVFVEGLNLASAILCGDNGIYVGQQPHLLHFRDDDGDDKPDAWRVCLTGFGREDTHELLNSFCWGPDGWLYMTHGVFTNSKVRRPGEPKDKGFKFDAGLGRARPASREKEAPWEFEVFADGTSNPWGCDYDAAGNFFVSACVIDHFFHLAPGGIYVRQGGAPENPYAYEQLPSIVKHKHFRAAYAGVQIYQGGVYPKDTWGHAFIGNIHDNAIHEEVITPLGAGFQCEPRRDFLRANDGWFRPVSTQTGPDGVLWIMDWCDKYPCYQNAKANPEGVDRDRGRIWRVVSVKEAAQQPKFDLKKLATKELVNNLDHSNNWMRRMSRRMLVEKGDAGVNDLLWKLATSKARSLEARMEAIWCLDALDPEGGIPDELAKSAESAIRAWAIRMSAGTFVTSTLGGGGGEMGQVPLADAQRLASDADPRVRHALAVLLRQQSSDTLTVDKTPMMGVAMDVELRNLINASAADKDNLLAFAIWMAFEPKLAGDPKRWAAWLTELAPGAQPLSRVLAHKTMRRLCDLRTPEGIDLAAEFCDAMAAHEFLLAHALDGLVKGQESSVIKPGKDVRGSLAAWRGHANADVRKHAQTLAVLWGDEAAVSEVLAVVNNTNKPEKDRVSALQSLRQVRSDALKSALIELLKPDASPALAVAAIRIAAGMGGDDFIPSLLRLAGAKDFGIRTAALEALAGRESWTKAMLEAIAEGKVSAAEFPAPVRRQLATSNNKAIRDQAFRVLGAWKDSSDDIKSLIAQKKQACLTGEPDLANGKLLFTGTCMVCHEFHGGGQKVGPDLIGSGRSNLDALLANVIDPNQIIGNGYENIVVATKDGRSVSGRMIEDTPGHVKLVGAGGAVQTVARDQIASLENTKQSLMPMGFGNLPDGAFRDLIWYILAPPEEGPLTKEKKEMLIRGVEVAAPTAKPRGTNWRAIDWESVSLWNPEWKVSAPDFERTPVKLADYYGRANVLLMHPFPDRKTPASFERKFTVQPGQTRLTCEVAADDRGDWLLKAVVNGKVVKEVPVDHEKPRWKQVEIDLSQWQGQEVTVRLESHPTGWNMEFAYWHRIEVR
jgi:putative membrane-bound dehydrogenase-like protein